MDPIKHLKNVLKHKTSFFLRIKINYMLIFNRNEEKLKQFSKELYKRKKFTKPRNEIDWFPSIELEKCINCKVCLEFCPKKVYELNKEDKVIIKNPYSCVMLCSGCKNKCSVGAIYFPNKKQFEKFVFYK